MIEIQHLWGDSLLNVDRFPTMRRLVVGPGQDPSTGFPAPVPGPVVLVDRGILAIPGRESIAIDDETDVTFRLGAAHLRVRSVAPERRLPWAPFQHVDWFFVAVCAGLVAALVIEAIVIVLVWLIIQLVKLLIALFATSVLGYPPVQIVTSPPPPQHVISVSIATPAPLPAPAPRAFFVEATPVPVPTIAPIVIGDILDKRYVRKKEIHNELIEERVAVLGVLSAHDSEISSIFGSSDLSEGVAYGGLIGYAEDEGVEGGVEGGVAGGVVGGVVGGEIGGLVGTGEGVGGLGTRGSGPGGGGTSLGLGGLGTRGSGRGAGGELVARQTGGYGVIGTAKNVGNVNIGEGDVAQSDRSAEEIHRVVVRHMSQIQYCYERELRRNDGLEGKVVISFTIAPVGTVSSVQVRSTTLEGDAVADCVSRVVRRMRFPEVEAEGEATVSYPFLFSHAGD